MLSWDKDTYGPVAVGGDGGFQQICQREHLCGIPGTGAGREFQRGKDQQDRDKQSGEQPSAPAADRSGKGDMQGRHRA